MGIDITPVADFTREPVDSTETGEDAYDGTGDAYGGPLEPRLVRRPDGGSTIVIHDHVAAVLGCGIAVTRGRECWRCGTPRQDVGVGVWMRTPDGEAEAFVFPFELLDRLNMIDDACMRRNEQWTHVRKVRSADAGGFYYANICPACATLQGDTFIYLNRRNGGGGFSNPSYAGAAIDWYDVPPLIDSRYHDQRWLAASPAIRRVDARRIIVHPRIAWNWSIDDIVYA